MGDGGGAVASFRFPGTGITGARWLGASARSPSRRRQASRSPPLAYRIWRVARRPGGPARLRATITSVRWPTTSRPSRIHDRRASSSRMPVASPTAAARPEAALAMPVGPLAGSEPGGSSTTRVIPARRASAARRPSRSANLAPVARSPRARSPRAHSGWLPVARGVPVAGRLTVRRAGRSMTSRSTARPASSEPAIDRPSSASAGVRTTSHSGLIPRDTASTGSSAAARSSQATIEPAACASAASRSASVVRPLEWSPRSATPIPRGTPPGPRTASSSRNPVEKTRSGSTWGCAPGASRGTVASAPTTSPTPSAPPAEPLASPRPPARGCRSAPEGSVPRTPGAAAPQRDRRVASAAVRSGEAAVIAVSIEQMFE